MKKTEKNQPDNKKRKDDDTRVEAITRGATRGAGGALDTPPKMCWTSQ